MRCFRYVHDNLQEFIVAVGLVVYSRHMPKKITTESNFDCEILMAFGKVDFAVQMNFLNKSCRLNMHSIWLCDNTVWYPQIFIRLKFGMNFTCRKEGK